MKNTNISFIIPAYNCAKFLPDAVNSIFNGNFTVDDEVIIVDDASTDNTFKAAESLQKKYSAIHIFRHHYNKGSAAAGRNTGIDNSKNELIFCLDADNILCPNSIPKLKEFMLSQEVDAAAFGEQHYFKKKIDNVTHKWTYYSEITLEKCINQSIKTPGPSGNYLFTKDSWFKAGKYFEPTLINQTLDSWTFLVRQLATGAKILTLKDTHYFHRYGHDSHYIREHSKGNLSVSALIALLPFLEFLDNSSIKYIMGKKRRYSWFSNIKGHPIKLKKIKSQTKELNQVLISFLRVIKSRLRKNSNPHKHTEKELINDLRKKISQLAPLRLSTSGANNVWIKHRNALRLHIFNKNPSHFLQWDFIKNTMSGENSPYVDKEFDFLISTPYWLSRYAKALIESPAGSPKVYKKYPQSSSNLIHQAYHISQFEAKTGIMIDKLKFVLEFGGGYGNMCLLFHNLGFKGKYIIFDLEEFSALQEYYLKSSGVEVIDLNENPRFVKGVACISNLSKLKPFLTERDKNLFLATWSISETSVGFRNNFIGNLPDFENYLIAYRDKFKEVDNVSYFSTFVKKKGNLYWHNWEIPHLKDNFYLIGSETKM